jgi:hypothetical protein
MHISSRLLFRRQTSAAPAGVFFLRWPVPFGGAREVTRSPEKAAAAMLTSENFVGSGTKVNTQRGPRLTV